jgi:allantoinase
MPKFSVTSRNAVLPNATQLQPATIDIEDGLITAVHSTYRPDLPGVLDLGDLYLLPGLVDVHVHLNEPGRTDWEGFVTGTSVRHCSVACAEALLIREVRQPLLEA